MQQQLNLVRAFHEKFHALVSKEPTLIREDLSRNRYNLMHEEVEEYKEGVKNGDIENIAKELSDVLFATYGTILEHGLQDKIEEIFAEVWRSNMSKEYHEYKMIKGKNFFKPDIHKFFTDKS